MSLYFAMDEIGSDNVSRLRLLEDKELVWSEIYSGPMKLDTKPGSCRV